jgi:hypothetical protein
MNLKIDISILVVLCWITVIVLAKIDGDNDYLAVMQETLRLLVAGYLGYLSHIPASYQSTTTHMANNDETRNVQLGVKDENENLLRK